MQTRFQFWFVMIGSPIFALFLIGAWLSDEARNAREDRAAACVSASASASADPVPNPAEQTRRFLEIWELTRPKTIK